MSKPIRDQTTNKWRLQWFGDGHNEKVMAALESLRQSGRAIAKVELDDTQRSATITWHRSCTYNAAQSWAKRAMERVEPEEPKAKKPRLNWQLLVGEGRSPQEIRPATPGVPAAVTAKPAPIPTPAADFEGRMLVVKLLNLAEKKAKGSLPEKEPFKYQLAEKIGSGSFGCVFASVRNGVPVAVKTLTLALLVVCLFGGLCTVRGWGKIKEATPIKVFQTINAD